MSDLLHGVPTEWLHETGGARRLARRQARLFVASRLLAASPGVLADVVRQQGTAVEVRPTSRARQMCRAAVMLADELIRINDAIDDETLPPATPAALTTAQIEFLRWQAAIGRSSHATRPPGLDDATAGDCRRSLLKAGLLATTADGWYELTAAGRERAGVCDGLKLGEIDDAA